MSKIILQKKKGQIIITNRLAYPESVYESLYNSLLSGAMGDDFLPLTVKQRRKEIRLECVVEGLLTLNQYYGGHISKKAFLDFVYKILLIIKKCERAHVNANNIDLQSDRLFIEPQTGIVKCILWPVVNNQRSEPPFSFFKQLPDKFTFAQEEDLSFLEQYDEFFNGLNPVSINGFEKLILRLQGRKKQAEPSAPSGYLKKEHPKDRHKNENKGIEYDPFSISSSGLSNFRQTGSVYCTACGAKNRLSFQFCSSCGNKLPEKATDLSQSTEVPATVYEPVLSAVSVQEVSLSNSPPTAMLGSNSAPTVDLGCNELDLPAYAYLIREKTGEKILIDKPRFRIGSEEGFCDYFVKDNTYISRSHADIVTEDRRYFIIDRNSTNKTFVDGRVIPRETEMEIFSETKIRLANEDFTFYVE